MGIMIKINEKIKISEKDITFNFIRSGGPGGQNVNKVSTAAELRFDVTNSSLPVYVKERLYETCKSRISKEGVLIITAKEFRTQEKNRDAAIKRLVAIISKACVKKKKRTKTKPTRSSVEKRIGEKKNKSGIKSDRKIKTDEQ
jgi:ribosome-associated protein